MASDLQLQDQIRRSQEAANAAKAAKDAGRNFDQHLVELRQSLPGFEETIQRRNRDARAAVDEAERERATAQAYSAKNPKLAQSHLNKANAAQKRADAAQADVDRAARARDAAKAEVDSYSSFAVAAESDTAERQAMRPGARPGLTSTVAAPGTSPTMPGPGSTPGGAPAPGVPPAAASSSVPSDPRQFQQYLNTMGAGLVVDGVIGPRTQAAAQRLGVPVPQAQSVSPAGGATAAGGVNTAPAMSTAPAGVMDDATLAQNFGYGTWILQVPELKAIVDRYAQSQTHGTPMTVDQLRTAVEGTTYWRTTSQSQRSFTQLQSEDPASAQAKLDAQSTYLQQTAATKGITITPDRLAQMATDSIRFGWSPEQTSQAIAAEFHYKPGAQSGSIGQTEGTIKQMAASYLIPISDSTLADWDSKVAAGTANADTFKQYMVDQAKGMFPTLSKQLDAGLTVDQLAEPYRQTAAGELGTAPQSIDFRDPKWMRALSSTDPTTGQPSMMGLSDWVKTIRSDPTYEWDKSVNGKAAYTQAAVALTQALGLRS